MRSYLKLMTVLSFSSIQAAELFVPSLSLLSQAQKSMKGYGLQPVLLGSRTPALQIQNRKWFGCAAYQSHGWTFGLWRNLGALSLSLSFTQGQGFGLGLQGAFADEAKLLQPDNHPLASSLASSAQTMTMSTPHSVMVLEPKSETFPQEIEGQIQLQAGYHFGFQLAADALACEGFALPLPAEKSALLPPSQEEASCSAPEALSCQAPLQVSFRFAPPKGIYVHLGRPVQEDGVTTGFERLELGFKQLVQAFQLAFESLAEVEYQLFLAEAGTAADAPVSHLENLQQVELVLPRLFYESERFYLVPRKGLIEQLQSMSQERLSYQRASGGMRLGMPKPTTQAPGSQLAAAWVQAIRWMESQCLVGFDKDNGGANRLLRAFNHFSAVMCWVGFDEWGQACLKHLQLAVSPRHLENYKLFEVPLEMPDFVASPPEVNPPYGKEIYVYRPSAEALRRAKPYNDLHRIEEKLPGMLIKNHWGEAVVPTSVPSLGAALTCEHPDVELPSKVCEETEVNCVPCGASWEPQAYSQVFRLTGVKMKGFFEAKNRMSAENLYSGYADSKAKSSKRFKSKNPELAAFPKVVERVLLELEAEKADDDDEGEYFDLSVHNLGQKMYLDEQKEKIERNLRAIEGLSHQEACERYRAEENLRLDRYSGSPLSKETKEKNVWQKILCWFSGEKQQEKQSNSLAVNNSVEEAELHSKKPPKKPLLARESEDSSAWPRGYSGCEGKK